MVDSEEAQLLAIYGRRRIGKTYLIRNFFKDKGIFFELTGILGGSTKEQLRNFSRVLNKVFNLREQPETIKNWQQALEKLLDEVIKIPEDQKVVLFFDELPWLATRRSDLIRSLEYIWNRYLSQRSNIVMILCGSAASWMINRIIHNRGGFHGRLTERIHLKPFNLNEAEQYLQNRNIHLSRKQLVEVYMVTGGVAKYLKHVERGQSSAEIIQNLCFDEDGFLHTEFESLFRSLFDQSEKHMQIIKILAKSHKGLTFSKIVEQTPKVKSGRVTEALKDLKASGFVQFVPFYGRKKRDGLYRLVDEYSLFYINWIDPHDSIINFHRSPKFFSWAGYAFENICIKHAAQIIEALKLTVVAKNIAYWDKRQDDLPGAQIDLIIDRTDRSLNLLEIKFSDDSYEIKSDYGRTLNQRRALFQKVTKSKKSIFNTLITPFGATKNSHYLSCIDKELTLDALFANLA